MTAAMKETRVKLHKRKLSSGNISLCAAITPPGGSRKIVSLKGRVLLKGSDYVTKQHNKNILALARQDIAELTQQANKDARLTTAEKALIDKQERGSRKVFSFFEELIEREVREGKSRATYKLTQAAFNYFKEYVYLTEPTFLDITTQKAIAIKDAIVSTDLDTYTKAQYLQRIKYVFREALRAEIIDKNPFENVKYREPKSAKIKKEDALIYLTSKELRKVLNNPPENAFAGAKYRMFVFGCFTGLRGIDLRSLTYSDISKGKDGYWLSIIQKKTSTRISNPLPKEALNYIDVSKVGTGEKVFNLVFSFSNYHSLLREYINKQLKLDKGEITLHSARHTCATVLLELGSPIYTVSKVLGHSSVTQTERYAHVIPSSQVEVMNLFSRV